MGLLIFLLPCSYLVLRFRSKYGRLDLHPHRRPCLKPECVCVCVWCGLWVGREPRDPYNPFLVVLPSSPLVFGRPSLLTYFLLRSLVVSFGCTSSPEWRVNGPRPQSYCTTLAKHGPYQGATPMWQGGRRSRCVWGDQCYWDEGQPSRNRLGVTTNWVRGTRESRGGKGPVIRGSGDHWGPFEDPKEKRSWDWAVGDETGDFSFWTPSPENGMALLREKMSPGPRTLTSCCGCRHS